MLRHDKKREQFRSVFLGTDEGRAVLGHIYKMCGYNKAILSSDPYTTTANAARIEIAQKISSLLNQSEEDIYKALKVAQSSIITNKGEIE